MSTIEEFGVRDDLLVAGVVGGCLVVLTLSLEFLLGVGDVSILVRIAPLYVYLLYLFFGDYVPDAASPFALWSVLSVLVTVGVVVRYAV
jgi:hypothetical protein